MTVRAAQPDARAVTVGTNVKAIRERRGWSQRALAERLGWPQQTVAKLELAQHRMFVEQLLDLADVLGVRPTTLLANTNGKATK